MSQQGVSSGEVAVSEKYRGLLAAINAVKEECRHVAVQFEKYPTLAVSRLERLFGPPVPTKDMVVVPPQGAVFRAAMRTLLASFIAERYIMAKDGIYKHVTVSIVGPGGSGKTTYAVYSGGGALSLVGVSRAYSILKRYVFFEPYTFVIYVKKLIERRRWVPFLILDDVGTNISKYWLWLKERHWHYLFSILDTIKDWSGVLVLTSRSFSSIPARMRELSDIVVEAKESIVHGAVVTLLKYYLYDDYIEGGDPHYIDVWHPYAKMPENIWNEMIEARRKHGRERLERFMKEIGLSEGEEGEEGGAGEEDVESGDGGDSS